MKADERVQRDAAIIRAVSYGVDIMKVARRHRLTTARIKQILKRENFKGKIVKSTRKRPWSSRATRGET